MAEVEEVAYYSAVCESFTCLPLAGGAADQPVGLMRRILLLRRYQRAHELVTGAFPTGPDGPPDWATVLVMQVQVARMDADMERRARWAAEDAEAAGG